MTETTEIFLPEGCELREFEPIAYFDKQMDCIRVITHDVDCIEERLNEYLTVHESMGNSLFTPKYVGFTLKGVKLLFSEAKLPLEGVLGLTDVINAIVQTHPGAVSAAINLLVEHFQTDDLKKLTINMDLAA